jgi:hypothetical protein
MKKVDLHSRFEIALRASVGKILSRQQLVEILQNAFPELPEGSVVPTDHSERNPKHVNQCKKCADPTFRIFDVVVDGEGVPGRARYRVRNFKSFEE